MSSKIITTVLMIVIVGPFTYMSAADAISIKHHLQEQNSHIQSLKTESTKLDTQLDKIKAVKAQTQAQVDQLDQQTKAATSERQQLEAELGAN